VKGSTSGLSFDNIQDSVWRGSETPGKIGIATAIRKGDLPNTRILEALSLEPPCPVKQNLKTCSMISQFMKAELENRLKKQSLVLRGNFEIWIRPFPLRIARNAAILFINRGGQKWHEHFSTLTSEGTWLSELILMFRVSVMYELYSNWLLLSTSYGKRKTNLFRTAHRIFYVCVTVHHWYNNINSQLEATIAIY